MGYPNAKQCIWMLEGSIRMAKRAFGYAGDEIWAAEAEGIRIPKNGILMPKATFECPRGTFGYSEQVAERRVSGF